MWNHLDSRIQSNLFESTRGNTASSGARHSIQPLPANRLRRDDQGSGSLQIILPPARLSMILITAAEECDPKSCVGKKVRRQSQYRLGVP